MAASATATFSSANRRASSARLSPCCCATVSAIAFQWPGRRVGAGAVVPELGDLRLVGGPRRAVDRSPGSGSC